jgi:uncharacterized membrane protein YdjX (TVP38/TMEM64 family)
MSGSPDAQAAPRSRNNTLLWISLGAVGLLLLCVGLYFLFSSNPVIVKYRELARFYSSKREVKQFLARFGPYAPLVFITLQALQVVVAPIPGEATGFLGGMLFGTWLSFIYSTIGLTLGSALAFGLGRWLGLPLVRRLVSDEVYHKFDFLARTGAELVTLIFFLIPGFPKDYLCLILGVSPLPFRTFLVLTTFGRMPGTWLLSVQGAKVGSGYYVEFVVFLTVAAVAAFLAYIFREAVFDWVRRRHEPEAAKSQRDRLSL